jgi:HEAT repeat protein
VEQQMWRRYGDATYTLITLAVFGFETIALGALSLSFLLGKASGIASTPVEGILLGIVISTASALALLGLYLLSYHFISNMRDRWQADQLDQWTEWWVGLALTRPDEPGANAGDRRRLPRVAVHSVLSLLEAVKGEEGDRLKEVLASNGVDRWFLRRARSGHLTAKLDAIENLGKARLPQAFDELLSLFHHGKPVVRRMSARAAGVTLAVMAPADGPDSPHARFIHAIKHADLQPGVVQEALLLLETRAGPILRELLADPELSDSLRWVALETIGRLGLADMADQVAASSDHPDPELRAATFRCLRRLGSVPEGAEAPLLEAVDDKVDFVRVQAAHAAAFLTAEAALPKLEPHLEDDSWWVRRAAAASLARLGEIGVATVRRAAESHPDKAAREMAVQILLEADELTPAAARLATGVA